MKISTRFGLWAVAGFLSVCSLEAAPSAFVSSVPLQAHWFSEEASLPLAPGREAQVAASPLQILTPAQIYGKTEFQIEASFTPEAGQQVTEFTARCEVNGRVLTQTFSGLHLTAGQPYTFKFDEPVSAPYGTAVHYQVWVNAGGTESARVEQTTTPLCFKTHRRTVVESGTGMWCPYCPKGLVAMDSLSILYPDDFIGIELHSRDDLEDILYVFSLDFQSFPSAFFNRKSYDKRPLGFATYGKKDYLVVGEGGWGTRFLEHQQQRAAADIDLQVEYTAPYMKVKTQTRFAEETAGETYQIAFAVVEDHVQHENYYQNNDFSGVSFSIGGFESKPHRIWGMEFNHVARAIYDDYQGIPGSVPTSIKPGETYQFETRLQLPGNVDDPKNVKIVAMLIRMSTGEIVNARQVWLIPHESTGITSPEAANETQLTCQRQGHQLEVSYVSASNQPVQLRLLSLQGTLIHQQAFTPAAGETVQLTLPFHEAPGVYILSAVQGRQTRAVRLLLQ